MNCLLTHSLFARETIRLIHRQIRDTDEPFASRCDIIIPSADRALTIDDFSNDYLKEAADTLVCRHYPLSASSLDVPANCIDGAVESWNGVTVRVVIWHDLWKDRLVTRFDAHYRHAAI